MSVYRVHPLREAEVAEAAAFLEVMDRADANLAPNVQATPGAMSRRAALEWHLRNPARAPGAEIGHLLRDERGQVVGTHLCLPQRFAWEARTLVGSCSATFFAAPSARRDGPGPSALFLEYLRLRGFDFRFATTCNLNSGAFWERLRATRIPRSEIEYDLPVRLGPLVEEIVLRGRAGSVLARTAGALASLAQPILDSRRKVDSAETVACTDWDRLARLSAECRDPLRITSVRSAEYLRWRYGEYPGRDRIDVRLMTSGARDVGWFALFASSGGRRGQIRSCALMDLVWRREHWDAARALRVVLAGCRQKFDLLTIRPRSLLGDAPLSLGARARRLETPTTYVHGKLGSPAEAADLFDFAGSDGDAAT
jgi:hypothetical protein